ncbi:hypothetical protein PIB30_007505 [Stylosanthes scabra]|uniref:Uncharacterized protein n=1 Tax=Stylosanthes scabra TaxID=79078 RepID=A0ABU6T4B8_9FABA|nr:hypothetical protein [Stylosanthes scabra]
MMNDDSISMINKSSSSSSSSSSFIPEPSSSVGGVSPYFWILYNTYFHPPLFAFWTAFGVYVAQNYQVPNIKKLADTALIMVNIIEEKYRKPNRRGDEDD